MSDKDDDVELVRGSGNVFRDLGLPNPDLEHLRAILARRSSRPSTRAASPFAKPRS